MKKIVAFSEQASDEEPSTCRRELRENIIDASTKAGSTKIYLKDPRTMATKRQTVTRRLDQVTR